MNDFDTELKKSRMLHLHFTRKNEWLRYRVPTCLGFFYLGLLADGASTPAALQRLGWLLLIYAGSGSFVRYYNDLFDIEADRLSRKFNLAAGDPPHLRVLRPLLSTALTFVPFLFLRDAGIALGLMCLQHLLYIAYSTPPLRLKTRGLAGVITDALYGQTLPPLAAVAVAASAANPEGRWAGLFLVSGLLLFVSGLNNILFHQLEDRRGDRRSGLHTFTAVSGPRRVREWVFRGLLPLELLLLLLFVLCWQEKPGIRVLIPVLVAAGILGWRVLSAAVIHPARLKRLPLRAMISLNPVYETVLPLSALVVLSVLHHPLFWLLAAGHLLLFPDTTYIRLEPALLWLRRVLTSAFWKTEKAFKDFYYHWLLVRYMELKVAVIETLARLGIKSK